MTPADPAPPADERPLVLVVEDDLILGMTLVDDLEEAGFAVAGPARSVAEAIRLLAHQRPQAALLDIDLRGETSFPVARALQAQSVPFAFVSGNPPSSLPPEFETAMLLEKPVSPLLLATALEKLMQG
ncbi:response regulator [Rhodobacter sp. CZR27]|uniref:response regulator n=1 Tax=Rhodobacter sp. CZR27 TaxID=2033869 RepID=UPI000BBE6C1A|nr:response regulator [Rhodobacter sp. CZR27]